jgi:hypothetical protein
MGLQKGFGKQIRCFNKIQWFCSFGVSLDTVVRIFFMYYIIRQSEQEQYHICHILLWARKVCDVVKSKEILCDEAWGDELYFTILFNFFEPQILFFFFLGELYVLERWKDWLKMYSVLSNETNLKKKHEIVTMPQ